MMEYFKIYKIDSISKTQQNFFHDTKKFLNYTTKTAFSEVIILY